MKVRTDKVSAFVKLRHRCSRTVIIRVNFLLGIEAPIFKPESDSLQSETDSLEEVKQTESELLLT